MSVENAKEYLKEYNLDKEISYHEKSTATVAEAAQRIGCTEGEIAKTMAYMAPIGPIVIVMAGDVKLSNRKYRDVFKKKAAMIKIDELEDIIGHPLGGVCPFGVKEDVKIYLDESLKAYKIVYIAAGSELATLGIEVKKLEEILPQAKYIDVSQK
ncbi:MAG: YbaK/EbsC family protein [Tissierellia bacterium]|nr:YbaK/EbsC family protein [Tissierellia bacterium]